MPVSIRNRPVEFSQSAIGVVRCYGDKAEAEAVARVQKYEKLDDREATLTWKTIVQLIRRGIHTNVVQESATTIANNPHENEPTNL